MDCEVFQIFYYRNHLNNALEWVVEKKIISPTMENEKLNKPKMPDCRVIFRSPQKMQPVNGRNCTTKQTIYNRIMGNYIRNGFVNQILNMFK